MTGVEILSQNNVYETEAYPWIIAIAAGFALLLSVIIAIVSWVKYGFDSAWILLIILITICGAWLGLIACAMTEHETDTIDYIEYKVTVSEDVNFVEFINKYELLEQDGKIFTVRERE